MAGLPRPRTAQRRTKGAASSVLQILADLGEYEQVVSDVAELWQHMAELPAEVAGVGATEEQIQADWSAAAIWLAPHAARSPVTVGC